MEPIEEQNNECNNWIDKVELSLEKASSNEFIKDAFNNGVYRFIQLSSTRVEIKKSSSNISLKFNFTQDLRSEDIDNILRIILDYKVRKLVVK